MIRGLVVGKFYPPHRGHKLLIDTAKSQVDHLDVMLCVRPEQSIPGSLRAAWLREIHPEATVIEVDDFGDDDNSERWAAFTKKTLGYVPDLVFTSEAYGDTYARLLGARHVLVDQERLRFPISATRIREDPLSAWEHLEPCVRGHFAMRVRVVGAESTGKTTLAQDLAGQFHTKWVPEYGREYTEIHKGGISEGDWTSEEFLQIALEQLLREDAAARDCNRVLICDTDPLATCLWHERYLGSWSQAVEKVAKGRSYALTLLTGDEIPFVQDGYRDGEHIRHTMTKRFEEVLTRLDEPFHWIRGSRESRLAEAATHILGRLR